MRMILITMLFILSFAGCKTKNVYVPVERTTIVTETVRDTVVQYRIEHIRDSVSVPVSDSVSYLSNRYAYTYARVSAGILHHSLSTWPDSMIKVDVEYIDRVRIDSIPVPYPVDVLVYKEKELSLWQKIRMRAGEVAFISALIAAVVFFIKRKVV